MRSPCPHTPGVCRAHQQQQQHLWGNERPHARGSRKNIRAANKPTAHRRRRRCRRCRRNSRKLANAHTAQHTRSHERNVEHSHTVSRSRTPQDMSASRTQPSVWATTYNIQHTTQHLYTETCVVRVACCECVAYSYYMFTNTLERTHGTHTLSAIYLMFTRLPLLPSVRVCVCSPCAAAAAAAVCFATVVSAK